MISEQEQENIKESIKQYYKTQEYIEMLHWKLQKLEEKLQALQSEKNSPQIHFTLSTDIKAASYENIPTGGKKQQTSPMEKEIDLFYEKLDKEYEKLTIEWLQEKAALREAEKKNETMEFCISRLEPQQRKALDLKYKRRCGITKLSLELHMARSTVNRYLYAIYEKIAQLTDKLETK